MRGRTLLFVSVLFVSIFGYCQDAVLQEDWEASLSLNILSNLASAKNRIEQSNDIINKLQNDLTASQMALSNSEQTTAEQQATLTRQSQIIKSISAEQDNLLQTIAVLRSQLKTAITWIIVLGSIFLLGILLRIAGAILWAKGIKLPYLLNLIM